MKYASRPLRLAFLQNATDTVSSQATQPGAQKAARQAGYHVLLQIRTDESWSLSDSTTHTARVLAIAMPELLAYPAYPLTTWPKARKTTKSISQVKLRCLMQKRQALGPSFFFQCRLFRFFIKSVRRTTTLGDILQVFAKFR
jgi:hypothetical protein